MNKKQELFFVEEAAKAMNVQWNVLKERESPDFIVMEGDRRFGLEVSELFVGKVSRKGSNRKAAESSSKGLIERFQNYYEMRGTVPLRVEILGAVSEAAMCQLTRDLLDRDLHLMKLGERFQVQLSETFIAHVTRASRANWFRIDDRIGWVNTNPLPIIEESVKRKSKNLHRYWKAVGTDVRLLLVANRLHASGKLKLGEASMMDTGGFRAVYFFSYPERVTVFRQ